MSHARTAILTVLIVLICESAAYGVGFEPPSEPSPPSGSTSRPEVLERIEVQTPRKVVIARVDGERLQGPWSGFDLESLLALDGRVRWSDIVPADRLRVGRDLIRALDHESPAAWSLLVAALELSGASDMADRARERLRRVADDRFGDWDQAATRLVTDARNRERAEDAAKAAVSMRVTRPHLAGHSAGSSARPARRPGRLDVDIDRDRDSLRRLVDREVDGLGLETVPTAQVIATASGPLESVAATGVQLDRFLGAARTRLGGPPEPALPVGGLSVIDPGDADVARILLARHLVDWPLDEPSILIPRPEGWIAILSEPDPARIERWGRDLPAGKAPTILREVELARIAARVAILEAGDGAAPPWMVEGFAEAAAQAIVDVAPIERLGRGPAVAAIRGGRHPAWITSLDPGDAAWSADGDARRTAHLLVSRLLESDATVLPGMVRDLGQGADVDGVFRRWTGLPLAAWLDDCVAWYRTND
jgi:hypothetical protein